MKNIFYKIGIIFTAFTCLFGVTIFFINSSTIAFFLKDLLNLKVAPSFTGGTIVKSFYDADGDDNGNGLLVYPSNKNFEKGCLDLISYSVHEPVYNAKWQEHSEYWQLDLNYKAGGEKTRNIIVYIGADNFDGKNVIPLSEGAENIIFNSDYPWAYALWIRDGKADLFSKEGEVCKAQIDFSNNGKLIKVRIPIESEELTKIYSSKITWHYVLTGVYSNLDRGGFAPIEKRKTISRGGVSSAGEFNQFIPIVYDILDDSFYSEKNQYEQLNSFDKENYIKATVEPVLVNMKEKEIVVDEYDSLMKKAIELISENEESNPDTDISDNSDKAKAIELFNKGNSSEAKELFKSAVKQNPDDAEAMAYYGSCVAMEAGKSNVMDAVRLVNEAYTYFDKAASLAEGKEYELAVLLNRASVSESVPDGVFHKMKIAAQDYYRCAELTDENKPLQAYLYLKSAKAYKNSDDSDSYEAILRKVKKLLEL